ncbi:MAG: hypothetical protein HYX61_03145 [Gammaproteobacteria bacterium]|nr:hypothetical protein [Gammaproteobacteria bacterium]
MLQSPTANLLDVFSKGPIFNPDNADFLFTRATFIRHLRNLDDLADMYPSDRSITASKRQFLEFIGQLVKDKNDQIASLIHDFLHQGRLVLKSSTISKESTEDVSASIAIDIVYPFLIGTGLRGKIIPYVGTGKNVDSNQAKAEITEVRATIQLLQALLTLDIFDNPFHIDTYRHYHQAKNLARTPMVEFCTAVTNKANKTIVSPSKIEAENDSKETDHSSLSDFFSRFSISSKPTVKPHFDAKKRLERSQSLRHYVRPDKLYPLQSTSTTKQRVPTQSLLKQFEQFTTINSTDTANPTLKPNNQVEKQKKPSV